MTDGLPQGWEFVPLKEFAKVEWGNTSITKKSYVPAGFPAFSASGQDGFLEDYDWEGPAVILSAIGARCGKCFQAKGKWTAIKNTIVIQGDQRVIDHKLLFHFLNDEKRWLISGTGQPFITMGTAQETMFPFAPLNEQRRIVAKLEQLLGKVDACQQRLTKIPALLKRFRQSVLAAACSGRLTTDWREKNPASVLQRDVNQSADLPEIPDSWRWIKLPDTGEMNRGRSRHRPRDEPSLYGGRYPFIQTGDIAQSGGRITKHKQTYNEAGLAQSRLWDGGTICITIAANIAESAILSYPACFPDSVVGLIVNSKIAKAEYVEFFIRVAKRDLATFAPATAQKNINIAILNEVQVPLPPLAEQKEIVRRVEELFALADQIEARYAKAKAYVDNLTQSILAKAFGGELVPQDPNDEPASVLLERIKRQREQATLKKSSKRQQTHVPRA